MCVIVLCVCVGVPLYASESGGSDETGRGTEQEPVKTILQVIVIHHLGY